MPKTKADVASVIPTAANPHPPWWYAASTGIAWVSDTATATALGITSADVLRLPASFGFFRQPIIGPVPSGGISGDATSSASTASLDAL